MCRPRPPSRCPSPEGRPSPPRIISKFPALLPWKKTARARCDVLGPVDESSELLSNRAAGHRGRGDGLPGRRIPEDRTTRRNEQRSSRASDYAEGFRGVSWSDLSLVKGL